eukprot:562295-Rhodomonas_salina.4
MSAPETAHQTAPDDRSKATLLFSRGHPALESVASSYEYRTILEPFRCTVSTVLDWTRRYTAPARAGARAGTEHACDIASLAIEATVDDRFAAVERGPT